ncbi:MAG: hypothetical protein AAF067_10125, partial [Pseudomonadota bacterium]
LRLHSHQSFFFLRIFSPQLIVDMGQMKRKAQSPKAFPQGNRIRPTTDGQQQGTISRLQAKGRNALF